jgi:ribonuclease E
MDPEQERVYGWMGLSPALLLDPVPTGDSLLVRVVRPGADAEEVLEEGRQQVAASGSRRRRRGRGAGESRPVTVEPGQENGVVSGSEVCSDPDEFMPMPIELPAAPSVVVVPARVAAPVARQGNLPLREGQTPEGEGEDAGEPHRRRRRSSATV